MYRPLFICLIFSVLSLVEARCNNVIINNLAEYNNLTQTISKCQTVAQLTIDNVALKDMNIIGSIGMLLIQNCAVLESVEIKQLSVISSITYFSLQFNNNSQLVNYHLSVSNSTSISFRSTGYPLTFELQPKNLLKVLTVSNTNWPDASIFASYNNLIGIGFSNIPTLVDLSSLSQNKFSYAINLVNLPLLMSLSFLYNTLTSTQIYLDNLPNVISLTGMQALRYAQYFSISNMPGLQDISELSGLHSTSISWNNVPSVCCPDISTGIYSNLASNSIPPCKQCFTINSFSPTSSPIEGGINVNVYYNGSIGSNSLRVVWGQSYSTCNVVSLGVISCVTPSVSTSQSVNPKFSTDDVNWIVTDSLFNFINWQSLISSSPSIIPSYNSITTAPLLPPDNSHIINNAIIIIWSLIGSIIALTFIIYLIFSLPNSLDLLRTPNVMNLSAGITVTGSKRTPLGSFFTISCILLLVGIILSSSISFSLDNTWGTTSLINPASNIDTNLNWAGQFVMYPSSICNDNTLTIIPQAIKSVIGDECVINWNSTLLNQTSLSTTSFSISSKLWSTYLYYVKYNLNVSGKLASSIQGIQIVSGSNTILKGTQGQVNIIASMNILNSADVGVMFLQNGIVSIPSVDVNDFLSTRSLDFSLNIKFTDYWQGTTVQSKQSTLNFLAEIVALGSGAITVIRLIIYAIARQIYKHSNKPDVALTLRKSTVKDNIV